MVTSNKSANFSIIISVTAWINRPEVVHFFQIQSYLAMLSSELSFYVASP